MYISTSWSAKTSDSYVHAENTHIHNYMNKSNTITNSYQHVVHTSNFVVLLVTKKLFLKCISSFITTTTTKDDFFVTLIITVVHAFLYMNHRKIIQKKAKIL